MSTTSSWIDIWIKELECEARFAFPLIIKMQIKEVPYSIQVFVPTPPTLCINFYLHGPNSLDFNYFSAQFNSMENLSTGHDAALSC